METSKPVIEEARAAVADVNARLAELEAENAAMREAMSSAQWALIRAASKLDQVGSWVRNGVELKQLACRTREVERKLGAFSEK